MSQNNSQLTIPSHIAIICDGNRRWARSHKLEVFKGHEHAVNKVFEPLIDHAAKLGIRYITFWIFSTENWQRDKKEVEGLMNLFRSFFDKQIEELHKKDVRVNMIGNILDFPEDIQKRIKKGIEDTKSNKKITVTLAMSYGGRDEIVRAMEKARRQKPKAKITEDFVSSMLDTAGMPDPELIVRTSGEQRLSGFMLWQSEYSEFYFPEWHFPEFTPKRLDECVEELNRRKRRFGK